jgi:hypothetical protein
MKTLKDKIKNKLEGQVTIDPTMNGRYGDKPLFQHKIDRLYELLKGTALDPEVKAKKAREEAVSGSI